MTGVAEPMRIIVLSGPPGVGKTEVGRRLAARCRVPSAAIDADRLADVFPWSADDRFYRLLARNVAACMPGYRAWGVRLVVLSAVLMPGRALDQFLSLIASGDTSWRFFGLRADERELRRRVNNDPKFQGADERISWGFLDEEVTRIPGVTVVDTTDLSIEDVVETLAAHEPGWFHPRPAPGRRVGPAAAVCVPVSQAADVATRALARAGFPARIAAATARDLLAAEMAGRASHGLLRVPEYVEAAAAGDVCPEAEPRIRRTTGGIVVDGRNAPAVTLRAVIADALVAEVARRGFAIAGLRNGAHLGRLRPLAEAVTAAGLVLLGWANFRGAGQKVAPPGAATGRIATNPLVFGCPAPPGRPVILDMSTSASSEGAIRAAWLDGRSVPGEYLRDALGRPVSDPARLYGDTPEVHLAPLGGAAAHKGFGLAVMAEVLAGIVAGGGFAGPHVSSPGNAALFITFPADVLGRGLAEIGADVTALETHLTAPPRYATSAPARMPGRGEPAHVPGGISTSAALWARLHGLADSTEGRSDHS